MTFNTFFCGSVKVALRRLGVIVNLHYINQYTCSINI
jgi:hypothetical protein